MPRTKSHSISEPAEFARVGLVAFFRIAEAWSLDTEQQMVLLGKPRRTTFIKWKKNEAKKLPADTIERISYLLGIYKALHVLFANEAQADSWVNRDNTAPIFAGKNAIEYMLHGKMINLFEVRRYLDTQNYN